MSRIMNNKGIVCIIILCCLIMLSVAAPLQGYVSAASEKKDVTESVPWYIREIGLPSAVPDFGDTERTNPPIVAVIDTGVLTTHPALRDSLWINTAERDGIEGIDDDGNGYIDDIYGYNVRTGSGDVSDTDGHGTHISGIIAMRETAEHHLHGVCPKARIMTVKAGNTSNGFSSENIIKALRYAEKNGADIINLSLGTTYCTDELRSAIAEAAEHTVLVAAAGNQSAHTKEAFDRTGENVFPAALSDVLGVMSFNCQNELSWFSNWDHEPDTEVDYELIAPGEDIYSTALKNAYIEDSGTSMSAAVVSGACSILICEWRHIFGDEWKDSYSPDLIKKCLLTDSEDVITYLDEDHKMYKFLKLNIETALRALHEQSGILKRTSAPEASLVSEKPDDRTKEPAGSPLFPQASMFPAASSAAAPSMDVCAVDTSKESFPAICFPPAQESPVPDDCAASENDHMGGDSSASDLPESIRDAHPAKGALQETQLQAKIQKRTPAIHKSISKHQKRLSFSIKGISADGWAVYRSLKKNGTYRRFTICKKNQIILKKTSQTFYYYVRAYQETGQKKCFSRKSKKLCVSS